MAQVVKLKRTAVQGKIPTTSSLELGELAINTYDGRIFFEKDNGTPSIQSVVVTDALITGSINLFGAVTASYFKGDGSQLTNLPNTDVSQVATVTSSFDNQSNISVTHNFNTRNIIVSVYDNNYAQIIPSSVILTNNNTTDIVLSSTQSGHVVVAKGGHIMSGSVPEVATITASFDAQSNISVTHNFNTKNIIISVYDINDSQIIPSSVTLTDLNTATIVLSSTQSGYVVIAKGGHLVTAIGTISYNNLTDIPAGIISSSVSVPNGTVSGSSQLTSSYDSRYVLSGSITQTTWDNITSKPSDIVSSSSQINVLSTTNIDRIATTGSNLFVGTQTLSGSIIPAIDNTYDLGSPTYQWRDIYVSSGSLYIDGTKVLGSTNQELQITTDVGQSIKILESGTDSIILQSADGDIQLKTSGGGNLLFDPTTGLIDVRGTLQIQDGYKVTSSGGTTIQFGSDLGITGSINTTGTINGINISNFQTTFNTFTGSSNTTLSGLNSYTSSLKTAISINGSDVTILGNLNVAGTQTIVDSTTIQIGDNIIELNGTGATNGGLWVKDATAPTTNTGSIIWDSTNDYWKAGVKDTESKILLAGGDSVVSGSSQIVSILSPLNTFSASEETKNNTLGTYTASLESKNSTLETYTGSIDTKNNTLGTYTASLETKNSTLATYTGSVNSQLTSLINATSSYETKGRGIVSGSSQVDVMSTTNISRLATTGSNTFNGNQIISGSLTTTSNATFNGGGIVLSGTASDTIQNSGAPYIYLSGGGSSYTTIQQGASKMRWWQFNGSSWVKTWDIDYTGNATLTGTFTENSSIRYKENVETIKYGLDKVLQLRGVTYNKKDNGVKEMGVIAEEIYEVLPEVVLKNEQGEIDSVSYGRITAILIEAIKDLKKEIEDLKSNR